MEQVADTELREDAGIALVKIAQGLAHELNPRRRSALRAGLNSSLDRDWGFDSLSRAELLLRVERAFSIHLPEQLLSEAETLNDLLSALASARRLPSLDITARHIIAEETAEPAPTEAKTLTEVLDWHVLQHGERVHIVLWHGDGEETSFTYRHVAERAQTVASGLRQAGLQPGERVAIMLPTSEAFFTAFFGVLYAGGVPTPIYPPARPSQIEEHLRRQAGILRNARAVLLIAAQEASAVARLLRLQVESLRAVISAEELSQSPGGWKLKVQADSTALMQYTSGSTGDPKGVVLSHANLLANIRAMGEAMAAGPRRRVRELAAALSRHGADRRLARQPLFRLRRSSSCRRSPSSSGRSTWLWAIHRHRATLSAAPNFAFELCLHKIEDADHRWARSQLAADGGQRRGAGEAGHDPCVSPRASPSTASGRRPWRRSTVSPRMPSGWPSRRSGGRRSSTASTAPRSPAKGMPCLQHLTTPPHLNSSPAAAPCRDTRSASSTRPASWASGRRGGSSSAVRRPRAAIFGNPAKNRELFDGEWLDSGDLAYIAGGDVYITGRSRTSSSAPAGTSTRRRSRRWSATSRACARAAWPSSARATRVAAPSE